MIHPIGARYYHSLLEVSGRILQNPDIERFPLAFQIIDDSLIPLEFLNKLTSTSTDDYSFIAMAMAGKGVVVNLHSRSCHLLDIRYETSHGEVNSYIVLG